MNISKNILDELEKKGWYPQRKINIDEIVRVLHEEGYDLNKYALNFFEQFAFLEFEHPAFRIEGKFDKIHFNPLETCENIYREKVETYENRIGESLVVIGEAYNGYLTLMISNSGKIYGAYDDFLTLKGESLEIALENFFNGIKTEEIPM